jgi:RNA polymerase sigma-70 factor (ECF subfamily)
VWNNIEEKQKAFQEEALQYMDMLYNAALKLTGNEKDAEDLMQETYYKAFRFFEQYEPGTSCKAWLFRILKNTFINKYRRQHKQPEHIDYNAVEPFIDLIKDKDYFNSSSLDEAIVNTYLSDEINQALSKLPYEFKMVLILADIEGFSYNEIAEIMNCPIGTVRSRLSRSRRMMFKLLLEYAKSKGFYLEEKKK